MLFFAGAVSAFWLSTKNLFLATCSGVQRIPVAGKSGKWDCEEWWVGVLPPSRSPSPPRCWFIVQIATFVPWCDKYLPPNCNKTSNTVIDQTKLSYFSTLREQGYSRQVQQQVRPSNEPLVRALQSCGPSGTTFATRPVVCASSQEKKINKTRLIMFLSKV